MQRAGHHHWPQSLQLTNTSRVINALRLVWVVSVAWFELGTFFWSVSGCRWPDKVLKDAGFLGKPNHVLVVADPQVLNANSYPGRSWWLSRLTQFIVDLNLRKSWSVASRFNPNTIVFLGDMMDNGRDASGDEEYRAYYERFKSIFTVGPASEVYYIPGNHDVGLGSSRRFSPDSRKRYIANFGKINRRVSIYNHTFALLDAPGLVEEDYRRASSGLPFDKWPAPKGGAIDFVREFASVGSTEPVILFSHIPLFRPDAATCGPLRERGTIRRGVGYGYQNTLGRHTSDYLFKNLHPTVIFSGDDHDYCEYTHNVVLASEGPEPRIEHVREVTVKSFSMAMGIKRPGFQLLSLGSSSALAPIEQTYADTPCFLPDQMGIYTSRYLPLFLLSLIILGISNFKRQRSKRQRPGSLDLTPLSGGSRPNLVRPESGIWEVTTPVSLHGGMRSRSPSPQPGLPSARTPRTPRTPTSANGNGLTPTYRASNSLSPLPSPGFLSVGGPSGSHAMDDDDGDPMSPTQYVSRRGSGHEPKESYFLLTSGRYAKPKRRWAWSYSFVFRGRRRRITVGVPPLFEEALLGRRRERGGRRGAVINLSDILSAAWPAVFVFALISIVTCW